MEKKITEEKKRIRDDISSLRAAINTGVLTVTSPNGRTVTYRSLTQMQKILDGLLKELALLNGIQPTSSFGRVMGYRSQYD